MEDQETNIDETNTPLDIDQSPENITQDRNEETGPISIEDEIITVAENIDNNEEEVSINP